MMVDTSQQESYLVFLRQRKAQIFQKMEEAAKRSGRGIDDIQAVAVSKTVDVDQVVLASQATWEHFAENRPQELNRKLEGLSALGLLGQGDDGRAPAITFDMIGHLQTNKINSILGKCRLIHSVDSTHLAQAIDSRVATRFQDLVAAGDDVKERCLLEVNVSGEATKGGFTPDEVRRLFQGQVQSWDHLQVCGFMTMAPRGDADAARRTFAGLKRLQQSIIQELGDEGAQLEILSCGMSDDFEIAIEEGSNLVRLGRIVFDPSYNLS